MCELVSSHFLTWQNICCKNFFKPIHKALKNFIKTSEVFITFLKALTLLPCIILKNGQTHLKNLAVWTLQDFKIMFDHVSILKQSCLIFELDCVPLETFYGNVGMNESDLGEKWKLSLIDCRQISFLVFSEF